MTSRPFAQIDVFTATPGLGNPLAVVLDGSGLSTEAMQQFTDWTNLSECTFVLPPTDEARRAGADYRVRIFCPGRELPFAGHPTLGTAHAWLAAGGRPQRQAVVQECGVGLVTVRRDGDEIVVQAGDEGIRFLLVSGRPLQEPVAWHGPIVMNTQEEIHQALRDLRNGTFIS